MFVPTAELVPTPGGFLAGKTRVANGGSARQRPQSTGTNLDELRKPITGGHSADLTAVVRLSPEEDDVLEIYAEKLDHETVEWIKRL
jgi:hypothetical protein